MRKSFLFVSALALSLTCSAQFGGGFPGGGMPPMGGGFPGLGGDQSSQAQVEYSEKISDVDYVGDGQVYHKLDIYLPKEVKDSYPVVVHIYGFSRYLVGIAAQNI